MADELRTALPDESILDRRSRSAIAHYRQQSARLRRFATSKRTRAEHVDEITAEVFTRHAADLDRQADQWDALAAELAAFADQQTPDPGETLL
jgi:hypothetical protein